MSNRFSLFGGAHSSAASTLKQQFGGGGNKKNKKRPAAGRAQADEPDQDGRAASQSVTLDAWIEAKAVSRAVLVVCQRRRLSCPRRKSGPP
jgi:hypothetical protein